MPSQHERVLFPHVCCPAGLLDGLRRRQPQAERQLAEHHNRRAAGGQLISPPAGNTYDTYDAAHLVLLWLNVRNLAALQVVAEREGLALPVEDADPVAAFYARLPYKLLRRLWDLGRDRLAFVEMLRRRGFWAEQQLAALVNDTLHPERPLPVPAAQEYARYDAVLLALLWAIADNETALQVLAGREGETLSAPPDCARVSPRLRRRLWELGRDGHALAWIWRDEESLDVGAATTAQTPEKVLGWKVLFQAPDEPDTAAAWEHLLRRHALLRDGARGGRRGEGEDSRQDRAADLMRQLPRWDLLTHPSLNAWLRRVEDNRNIDRRRRQHGVQPAPGGPERHGEQVIDPAGARPVRAADARDHIGAAATWQDDALHRALLHWDWPVELRDRVVRENFRRRGIEHPTAKEIADEEQRIAAWLSTHRDRTNANLAELLLFHRPVMTSQKKTISRLRVLLADCREAMRALARRLQQPEQRAAAVQILQALRRFLERAGGKKRRGDWPVLLFAGMVRDARAFLSSLAGAIPNDSENAVALGRCLKALEAFWKRFPVLAKLARVRDLCAQAEGPEVHDLLLRIRGWLDAGETWLITFGRRDSEREKARCEGFADELEPVAELPGSTRAARRLLLLWLRAVGRPGPAEQRLLDLDRVWALAEALEASWQDRADEMVEHACRGNWPGVAELAARLLPAVSAPDGGRWWERQQLRLHLQRLQGRSPRTRQRLQRCRHLAALLRKDAKPEAAALLDRLADWLADAGRSAEHGRELRAELARRLAGWAGLSGDEKAAWLLLDLCLQECLETGAAVRGTAELYTVWTRSRDADERWGADFAARACALVAAFHRCDRDQTRQALRWLLRQVPHRAETGRGSRTEMANALGQLLRRPRRACSS
jgi:hypothetical protein